MKPQSNKKISHYNTGQPWIEKQKAKPKTVAVDVDNPYTPATVTDTSGFYYTFLHVGPNGNYTWGDPWDEKQKQPETISIYTAREIPSEDEPKYVTEAIHKFDTKVWVVTEKKIEKKTPKPVIGWEAYDYAVTFCADIFRWTTDIPKSLPDRCKDFLKTPVEVENPSGLILPDSLIEEKRQEKQLERMVAFVDGEIATVKKAYQGKVDQFSYHITEMASRVSYLEGIEKNYSELLDKANKELKQLRGVQATIAARSVDMTERTRHFRDEE